MGAIGRPYVSDNASKKRDNAAAFLFEMSIFAGNHYRLPGIPGKQRTLQHKKPYGKNHERSSLALSLAR
jgi:hypothetical protein